MTRQEKLKTMPVSDGIKDVLTYLPRHIKTLDYEITGAGNLVNLSGEMKPEGSVCFASIRVVLRRSFKGIQLLLRRYDPTNTTTNVRPEQIRKTSQGTWVTVPTEMDAVEVLTAHYKDMRNRVATGARFGIRVLDNRRFNRQSL